ncbi:unnamed protein product [Discosporangium mesarthrocarpum]
MRAAYLYVVVLVLSTEGFSFRGVKRRSAHTMRLADGTNERIKHIEEVILPRGRGLRVHALSDMHVDYRENLDWIRSWRSLRGSGPDRSEDYEDVLLVPGDISSRLHALEVTLKLLTERFDQVFFVAGNHELWASEEKLPATSCSVAKLAEVHRLCECLGVRTTPASFVTCAAESSSLRGGAEEVCIFPLLSWYHASWDGEPDLPAGFQHHNRNFLRRWGDFRKCRWPPEVCRHEDFVTVAADSPGTLADYFATKNTVFLEQIRGRTSVEEKKPERAPLSVGTGAGAWAHGEDADDRTCDSPVPAAVGSKGAENEDSAPGDADGSSRVIKPEKEGYGLPWAHGKVLSRVPKGGVGTQMAMEMRLGDRSEARTRVANTLRRVRRVISFSHFVPRSELCPEKRFLNEPMLPKVIGSSSLERQIRELGSDLHVYGHTHIPYDLEVEGVRYIQWPLGSVAEQSRQCKVMRQRGPLEVYSRQGHSGVGQWAPVEPTLWGDYYRSNRREPHEVAVPEWALSRLREKRGARTRRAASYPPPTPGMHGENINGDASAQG